MPNLKQHSKRIRLSLAWFDSVKSTDPKVFINPLTNEYFYCALHMFEACAVAFPSSFSKAHFLSHTDRNVEIEKIRVAPFHQLNSIASAYLALFDLSKRARYLQISERYPVAPLRSEDLKTARDSFAQVKAAVEKFFLDVYAEKTAPWLARPDAD